MAEKRKLCFFDIECDFGKNSKLLNIGFASGDGKIREEYWIWQREEFLYYPGGKEGVKYAKILDIWRKAPKTPLAEVLDRMLYLSNEYTLAGWNIKNFDLNKMTKHLVKYKFLNDGEKWETPILDSYLGIKSYVLKPEHQKLRKKLREFNSKYTADTGKSGEKGMLTAETMFRWVTGCTGYIEKHTALYDAEDERHITRMLIARYGKSIYELGTFYEKEKEKV